jgi:hypothetical protein
MANGTATGQSDARNGQQPAPDKIRNAAERENYMKGYNGEKKK